MDYNTSRTQLNLPEYGRNIQKLVEYTKEIEDREEKNKAALAIINIMGNMNPHLRDINDFKHKLWDQLAIMSNFELDIDSPYPSPSRDELYESPEPIPYKEGELKFKTFGRTVTMFVKKAATYENQEERNALMKIIGGHMKKTFYLWNNEHLSDDAVIDIVKDMTKGKINLPKGFRFDDPKTKKRR